MAVDGTYETVVKSPMGDQKATLTVKSNGDDTWSGTQSGAQGTTDIANGTIHGNTIRWSINITVPMPMTLTNEATIDGDTITGTVTAGAFGSFPLSGTRTA